MTVAQGSRPVPLSRVWAKRRVIAEDLTGDDLGDVLELHSDASAWWVLPRGDDYAAAELREVAKALELDHLAVNDLMAEDRRAKFETIGQARLVLTNSVSVDRQRMTLSVHPLSVIATDRALICLVTPGTDFQPAQLLISQEEELAEGGVETALQVLVAAVVKSYEVALEYLEDAGDDLSEALFEERPLNDSEQLTAFRLRTASTQLRRLTEPMRDVLSELSDTPPATPKGKHTRSAMTGRRWTIIGQQANRVASGVDDLREALSTMLDTSLALADARGNQVMGKFTGWAAIIAVPTLIASFAGMNVGIPLDGTTAGFWLYFVIMVAAGAVLFAVFRRLKWI